MYPYSILVGMMLALAGCAVANDTADIGQSFDPTGVARLRPGVSTQNDAIAALGSPLSIDTQSDGSQLLKWYYAHFEPTGTAALITGMGSSEITGAHVEILFGSDGRMIRVMHDGVVTSASSLPVSTPAAPSTPGATNPANTTSDTSGQVALMACKFSDGTVRALTAADCKSKGGTTSGS